MINKEQALDLIQQYVDKLNTILLKRHSEENLLKRLKKIVYDIIYKLSKGAIDLDENKLIVLKDKIKEIEGGWVFYITLKVI